MHRGVTLFDILIFLYHLKAEENGVQFIGFFFTRFFGFLKITNVSGFLQKFKLYQVQCIRLTKKCIRFFYQVVKLYQGGKYQVFEIFDFLPG